MRRSRTDLMRSLREVLPPLEQDSAEQLNWRHSQKIQEKSGIEDFILCHCHKRIPYRASDVERREQKK